MGKFSNSVSIAKSSVSVLKADKELAVLPVLGFVMSVAMFGVFGALIWATGVTKTESLVTNQTEYAVGPAGYVLGLVMYLVLAFVNVYFTSVLVAGAHQRLTGGEPTLGSSFEMANKRIGAIFGWAMLTGTVGMILQMISQRAGIIGRIVIGIIGMAWEIVTWLAIPVVVVEGTGPVASLKRSAGMFKQTWGENLIAQGGLGIIGLLMILPGLLIAGLLIAIGPTANVILGTGIGVVWIGGVCIFLAALNGIFRTALYMYASTGQLPPAFSAEAVQGAFGPKKKGLLGR